MSKTADGESTSHQVIARPEPIVRADTMAYVRFARKAPDVMERFLLDFGFSPAGAAGCRRFFRGVGHASLMVEIEQAPEDAFLGFGVTVPSISDLEKLAAAVELPVEELDAPGGGKMVRLTDPDGLAVDVLYGAEAVDPEKREPATFAINTPQNKTRVNQTIRPPLEPSPIFKLGHVVLQRPDFDASVQWYMRHLGLIASDIQVLDDGSPALGFFRLDRGETPADHHSVAILRGPAAKLLHVSFETSDLDAVGQGHQYLRARGWKPYWGIGRHELGSQIFDYWKDPAGDEWEHYADGDVMTADFPTGYHQLNRGTLWTWGDDLPDDLRPDVSEEALGDIHATGAFGDMPLETVQHLVRAMKSPPRPWLK